LKAGEQFVLLIRVQSENASQIGCNVTLPKKPATARGALLQTAEMFSLRQTTCAPWKNILVFTRRGRRPVGLWFGASSYQQHLKNFFAALNLFCYHNEKFFEGGNLP